MLILSLAAALFATIAKKYFSDKRSNNFCATFAFNAVTSFVAVITFFTTSGFDKCSAYTLLLGLLFGLITTLQCVCNIAALSYGPLSYTTVIVSFSTIIPSLSGVLFFGEDLGVAQIIGIVLMLVSFVLAVKSDADEKNKKANLKWLILCVVAFLANGSIGVLQKIQQASAYSDESNAFLIISFIFATILSAIFVTVFYVKNKTQAAKSDEKQYLPSKANLILVLVLVVAGICMALNHKFNLYLSGVIDSAIFFPVVNGGGLVLTTVASLILFKEKLSAKQWAGIVIGIISVVFLCNPFGI